MTDLNKTSQVQAGSTPVAAQTTQTPDWRTLDFAADCLCTRSVAQPDRQSDRTAR